MRRTVNRLCLILLAAFQFVRASDSVTLKSYSGLSIDAAQETLIVIRCFTENKTRRYLALDDRTLRTRFVNDSEGTIAPLAQDSLRLLRGENPYFTLLTLAGRNRCQRSNAGLRHAPDTSVPGSILTVDLCPSRHPLDTSLFHDLVLRRYAPGRPVPLGVAVSGYWLKYHPKDLAWLLDYGSKGYLSFTWINHTMTHGCTSDTAIPPTFCTTGVDMQGEILKAEKAMMEQGLTPSIFFRFPGLISDSTTFRAVLNLGLIPLGSDAWLAKGKKPAAGAIILVHGNGNERAGVRKLLGLLNAKPDSSAPPFLPFLDLTGSLTTGRH